jgi:DNA-binding response OmpR family regulator
MARVLVVDDEVRFAESLGRGLAGEGYDVELAHDGFTGYRRAKEPSFDVIVLDLMLPGMSGTEVCHRLRAEDVSTPILVLTARSRESDETDALGMGADDYLRKPFSFAVLVARCRALMRRGSGPGWPELQHGDLVLDPRRRIARRGDEEIPLSRRETALLEYLIRSAGRVRSKSEILEHVWGEEATGDPASSNVVEVYIGYLRRKVDQPFGTHTVTTVRGRGYQLLDGP